MLRRSGGPWRVFVAVVSLGSECLRALPAVALVTVMALAPLAHVSRAAAQDHDAEARALYSAGSVAFSAGRYDDALEYFQRAYGLSHRVELLYNIGLAADRARHDEIALEAFRRYLDGSGEVENRSELEGRIRVLERAVAASTAAPVPPPTQPEAIHPVVERAPPTEVLAAQPPPPPEPRMRRDVADAPVAQRGPDVGALISLVTGGVAVIAGGIMLGVGAPELYAPRPGFIFAMEELRIQNAQILTGIGGAALGVGVIGAVVGVAILALQPGPPAQTVLRASPSGIVVSF